MSVTSKSRIRSPEAGNQARARAETWMSAPELRAYRTITNLASPAAGFILRHRQKHGKEDPLRINERLGEASRKRPDGPLTWIHAASVGEANSVLPLIQQFAVRRPDVTVLLTTGTVTSAEMVASRLPANAIHQYVPLDAAPFVSRFLAHWRPSLAIFTEQEIWPNLIVETSARGIPMAIINGRMSERSGARWQKRRRLAAALFDRFDVVLAQSEEIAARFRSVGATSARNVGNLKIDSPPPPVDQTARQALQAAIAGRPCLLAASTHDGEETIIADAHKALAERVPGMLTIIAPRHASRGEAIAEMLRASGVRMKRRAVGELPDNETGIYLADTMGELGTLYATCSVAFIGGSLIPHGGQNPIEAVHHGAVVLTGSSRANFAEIYASLLAAGGAFETTTTNAIADRTAALLTDPEKLAAARNSASKSLESLSGALEKTWSALWPLLPEATELPRAP